MKMWLPMQAGDRVGVCLWMSLSSCGVVFGVGVYNIMWILHGFVLGGGWTSSSRGGPDHKIFTWIFFQVGIVILLYSSMIST